MSEQKIIFCKGLPASGKSTWAKQHCAENPEFIRINKDDIRNFDGNPPYSKDYEKSVLARQRDFGLNALLIGRSLIVDDTNFAPYHWEFWSEIAKSIGISIEIKEFNTPVEECIQRDAEREKSVGKSVIMGMYKNYIEPRNIKIGECTETLLNSF